MITQERLKELLSYDPETGEWRHKARRRGIKVGAIAGATDKDGYRVIQVDGRRYQAARLAFLYMTGAWPTYEADHRDLNRSNDRWENLRDATRSQNNANTRVRNKLGVKGVRRTRYGTYEVRIKVDGRDIHLGTTKNLHLAGYMYQLGAAGYFREFARA